MSNDPTAAECSPDDVVVLDAWEAGDSKHFTWDAFPDTGRNDDVPLYQSRFTKVLQDFDEESKEKQEQSKTNQAATSCFNCLGNHNMSDCNKPRNSQAISKNRREFMNKNGNFNYKRYHLAEDQLYAHMKPGQISDALRDALGVGEYELPRHIYAMRNLGYPPAWLEDIKTSYSGLAMHGGTNNDSDKFEAKYDIDKIIEFPGFNVPSGPATKDEYRQNRCPPMEHHHSKEMLIKRLNDHNASADKYQSRKPRREDASPPRDVNELFVIDKEGETDDVVSELAERSNMGSPSLEDLETRKQLLMKELESGGATTPSFTPEQEANVGKVKHIDLGTPILKSSSPYSRIPAADNFSIGICDVINFENLPDSTGHYLRMNKVIHKIRKFNASKLDDDET